MSGDLSPFKALIFDVYATLVDWETGIYDALKPLLSAHASTSSWSKKDALLAFASVETDLQAKHPTMLYSELLSKAHAELETRLTGNTSVPEAGGTTVAEVETSGSGPSTTTAATSSSGDASTSPPGTAGADPHAAFAASLATWPIFPDTIAALGQLSALGLKLIVLSNVDRTSFAATQKALEHGFTFDAVITAQDVGSYKPALRNFEHALAHISSTFDIPASRVLAVAQSLPHDHVPASRLGLASAWIDRRGAHMCLSGEGVPESEEGKKKLYGWRFETLGEFSQAMREAKEARGES